MLCSGWNPSFFRVYSWLVGWPQSVLPNVGTVLSALAAQKAVYWCRGQLKGSDSAVFFCYTDLVLAAKAVQLALHPFLATRWTIVHRTVGLPKGPVQEETCSYMALILLHESLTSAVYLGRSVGLSCFFSFFFSPASTTQCPEWSWL